jgi:hypothetical protein
MCTHACSHICRHSPAWYHTHVQTVTASAHHSITSSSTEWRLGQELRSVRLQFVQAWGPINNSCGCLWGHLVPCHNHASTTLFVAVHAVLQNRASLTLSVAVHAALQVAASLDCLCSGQCRCRLVEQVCLGWPLQVRFTHASPMFYCLVGWWVSKQLLC